jgi:hypothetical protein
MNPESDNIRNISISGDRVVPDGPQFQSSKLSDPASVLPNNTSARVRRESPIGCPGDMTCESPILRQLLRAI